MSSGSAGVLSPSRYHQPAGMLRQMEVKITGLRRCGQGIQEARRLMMRPAMHYLSISAVRADALFVSALQRCDYPSAEEVRQVVAEAVEAFGQRGCAGRVAQEFGDHPETAITRMRWARQVAGKAFSEPGPSSAGAQTLARPTGTHTGCAA